MRASKASGAVGGVGGVGTPPARGTVAGSGAGSARGATGSGRGEVSVSERDPVSERVPVSERDPVSEGDPVSERESLPGRDPVSGGEPVSGRGAGRVTVAVGANAGVRDVAGGPERGAAAEGIGSTGGAARSALRAGAEVGDGTCGASVGARPSTFVDEDGGAVGEPVPSVDSG